MFGALLACLTLIGSGEGSGARPLMLHDGRWLVRVAVEPTRSGPIQFGVGPARHFGITGRAHRPRGQHDEGVQHDLVLRNAGSRQVTFDDTRRSTFLGPRSASPLLAADEGCGYAKNGNAPLHAGVCAAYLDRIELRPGRSARRTISLTWGLPGMGPLARGRYVFRKPMRFRISGRGPGGEPHPVLVRLTYEVR
jgi:hypothetical protein